MIIKINENKNIPRTPRIILKKNLTFDSSNVECVTNNVSLTMDNAGPGLSNATNIRLKCFTG